MDARLEWDGFLGFWLVFFGLGGSIFGFGDRIDSIVFGFSGNRLSYKMLVLI